MIRRWSLYWKFVSLFLFVIFFITTFQYFGGTLHYLRYKSTLVNNYRINNKHLMSEKSVNTPYADETSAQESSDLSKVQNFQDELQMERTTPRVWSGFPDVIRKEDNLWCRYLRQEQAVNPHPYRFVVTAESLCLNTPYLLIVVPSVCSHTDVRKEIRQTWGSVVLSRQWANGDKLPAIKLAFLFGKPVDELCAHILKTESKLYGDIIASDFIDSYRNLTLKSVSLLKWVTSFCKDVPYVMKCDEDTFVHLPRMIHLIKTVNSSKTLIGMVSTHKPPFQTGRWAVNNSDYPFREYPVYIQGQVYVIPGPMVLGFLRISAWFKFIPIEDVFVTGILAKCSGAKQSDLHGKVIFGQFDFHKSRRSSVCYFHKFPRVISVTKTEASDLKTLWNSFKKNSSCFVTMERKSFVRLRKGMV